MQEIEIRRIEINQQIAKINKKGGVSPVTFEQIKNVFIDGNISSEKYLRVKDVKRRSMLEKLLSNATVKDKNILNYQFKSPYTVLANADKKCDLETMCE
jgi:archaellum component FlaG (FlaF/FlaG flagellin family)